MYYDTESGTKTLNNKEILKAYAVHELPTIEEIRQRKVILDHKTVNAKI